MSLVLTLEIFLHLFSSIFIVDFEQVIVCWDIIIAIARPNFVASSNCLSILLYFLTLLLINLLLNHQKQFIWNKCFKTRFTFQRFFTSTEFF